MVASRRSAPPAARDGAARSCAPPRPNPRLRPPPVVVKDDEKTWVDPPPRRVDDEPTSTDFVPPKPPSTRSVGEYRLYKEIATGGMGTIHLARKGGAGSFSRAVAVKRLHSHFAADPELVAMLHDEAMMASCVRHANVVSTLDLVHHGEEVLVVMEYVHGASLAKLVQLSRGVRIPLPIVTAIMCGVLRGLHAAHEAKNRMGSPLGLVHRDVSPHNVLVGIDGIARVVDFGVAKANGRMFVTRDGRVKGKFGYIAPEQRLGHEITRAADVYSAAVVLWELVTGERLFEGDSIADVLLGPFRTKPRSPRDRTPSLEPAVEAIIMRGLASEPCDRFATALDMARELERASREASATEVGEWVTCLAHEELKKLSEHLSVVEEDAGAFEEPPPPVAAKRSRSSRAPVPSSVPSFATETTSVTKIYVNDSPKSVRPRRGEQAHVAHVQPLFLPKDPPKAKPAMALPTTPPVASLAPVASVTPVTYSAAASLPPAARPTPPPLPLVEIRKSAADVRYVPEPPPSSRAPLVGSSISAHVFHLESTRRLPSLLIEEEIAAQKAFRTSKWPFATAAITVAGVLVALVAMISTVAHSADSPIDLRPKLAADGRAPAAANELFAMDAITTSVAEPPRILDVAQPKRADAPPRAKSARGTR